MSWDDHLDSALQAVHARLSRHPEASTFQLSLPEKEAREALADLLGLPKRPAARTRVRVQDVRDAVEAASGMSLSDYLEAHYGPLLDPAAPRRHAASDRARLWQWWSAHPFLAQRPTLTAWAETIPQRGTRGGVAATRLLLERAVLVLEALPAYDELLPVFAGRLLNDTHALDASTALSGMVLGAVAADQDLDRPREAAGRRALWRSVGIRDDELSSTVLVAGLRPNGRSTVAQLCRIAADAGEVLSLTLSQVRQPVDHWGVSRLYVVENPAMLALATGELGTRTPPMICSAGWPTAAVTELVCLLTARGAVAHYHGDLDGEGIRIAAHLIDLTGVRPWRMTTNDYLAHVGDHGSPVGRVSEAPWDATLAPAMREHQIAVLEETVWETLRGDLGEGNASYPGSRRG